MQKFISDSPKRVLIISLSTFVIALLSLISVGYAWFIINNQAASTVVANVGSIDANYSFYIYLDSDRLGDSNQLISNQCASSTGDNCYWLIENTGNPASESVYIFGSSDKVIPGDRFSFALRVTNIGNMDSFLNVAFENLISYGYNLIINKIQVAFQYQVTRISYMNVDYQGPDIKENNGIIFHEGHFSSNNDAQYSLAEAIPLNEGDPYSSSAIIFFDLYFDPNVTGYFSSYSDPMNNSNAFENQNFTISKISIKLLKQ